MDDRELIANGEMDGIFCTLDIDRVYRRAGIGLVWAEAMPVEQGTVEDIGTPTQIQSFQFSIISLAIPINSVDYNSRTTIYNCIVSSSKIYKLMAHKQWRYSMIYTLPPFFPNEPIEIQRYKM